MIIHIKNLIQEILRTKILIIRSQSLPNHQKFQNQSDSQIIEYFILMNIIFFYTMQQLISRLRDGMASRQAQDERQVIQLAYKQLEKQDFDRALILYMHAFEFYPSRELEGYIVFCMNILGQYKGAIEYKSQYLFNAELMINQCFSHLMLGDYISAQNLVKNLEQNESIVKEINTIILIQQNQENKIKVDELELQNPIQKCVINELRKKQRQLSKDSISQIKNFINERGAYLKNTSNLVEKIEEIFNNYYTLKKHRIKSLKLYSLISYLFPQSVHYKSLEKLLKKMEQIKESKYINCNLKLFIMFCQQQSFKGFDNVLDIVHQNIQQLGQVNKSGFFGQNDAYIDLAYGCYKISKKQIFQREINRQLYQKVLLKSTNTYYKKLGQLYDLKYFQGRIVYICFQEAEHQVALEDSLIIYYHQKQGLNFDSKQLLEKIYYKLILVY
ncbi:hypothetical protein pb186bvf_015017 [Paramecium bursaria]